MGIFSKIKSGISSKANAALDKAIDPEKELDMAIMELEEGRKKALQELISYKATAKTLDGDMEKYKAKATEWERRAMVAVKAGDDEAAKIALKEKKAAEIEVVKIERDKHEAASYAIQLNKSRKDFEIKLQVLKLRKGTLATQIASARSASGDAFGNDSSVWDRFKAAEDRIDSEAIETEVDMAMRGEDMDAAGFDSKLMAAQREAGMLGTGVGVPDGPEDALSKLKSKMADQKAAKQKSLEAAKPDPEQTKPGDKKQ
jgi:phage shock protein A